MVRLKSPKAPGVAQLFWLGNMIGVTVCVLTFEDENQCTEKDAIPLPRTDDVLEAVGGAQWFTCLDLASGYWQLQVKEEDRPKTAFSTHRGQFEWKVMPFGFLRMGPQALPG